MESFQTEGTRSAAIKKILSTSNATDLFDLYCVDMECQVLVAQGDGHILSREYKGPTHLRYTNDRETWYSFRIPKNAMSEPVYVDGPMTFDLAAHVEAIGMTGWNWAEKKSIFVAYDFDSIIDHKEGLHLSELEEIKERAMAIPYVTVRYSTSGKGLHLYVFIDSEEMVANHTEHAAIARSILNKMSSDAGFNFSAKVDVCGGNMWAWARKMIGTDGLKIIKQGDTLADIPPNWRDHLPVIQKRTTRITLGDQQDLLTERRNVPIDAGHMAIMKALEGTLSWWDADRNLLVTHTASLKAVHSELGLKGIFDTVSTGKAAGQDYNCFCIPLPNSAFVVYRFSETAEHVTWLRDSRGVSYAYFNREADLRTLARAHGGVEREKGGYLFDTVESATLVLEPLGIFPQISKKLYSRQTLIQMHKDGRIIVKIAREPMDDPMVGWEVTKDKMWTRIYSAAYKVQTDMIPQSASIDDTVRHIVDSSGNDGGWVLRANDTWHAEPLVHVRMALKSQGYSAKELEHAIGDSVINCWTEVNKPFAPEYPGNREWNRDTPKIIVTPSINEDRNYPSWLSILQHCGQSLDLAVSADKWCKNSGIHSGADYLKCWIASLFQYPTKPLPYLFFYGPQNSGKSIFHEALSLLFHPGYARADNAIMNPSGFTGELRNAVLCVIEETDLKQNKMAYNRIKDWVTSLQFVVHTKGQTPYQIPNVTHWVQCANDRQACPIFPGDTRIVVSEVPMLSQQIPKDIFLSRLRAEAPDFIAEVLSLELPPPVDRLNIPPVSSEQKMIVMEANTNLLDAFIRENVHHVPGCCVKVGDFISAFHATLDPVDQVYWTKIQIAKNMPSKFPKGRLVGETTLSYGNMSLKKEEPKEFQFVLTSSGVLIPYIRTTENA